MAAPRFMDMTQLPGQSAQASHMQHSLPQHSGIMHANGRSQQPQRPFHPSHQANPPSSYVAQKQQQQPRQQRRSPHSLSVGDVQHDCNASHRKAPNCVLVQPPSYRSSYSSSSSTLLDPSSNYAQQQSVERMGARPGSVELSQWSQPPLEVDWRGDDDEDRDEKKASNTTTVADEDAAQNVKVAFACPHCDKCYKGKHARSIWRRHLQDKHGIPLSVQPRRTRWDADANRPKNAEERRERMLESKRRWARKKRAMDKLEAKKLEATSDGGDSAALPSLQDEDGAASRPGGPDPHKASAQWAQVAADHATSVSTCIQLRPQALFDGAENGTRGSAMGLIDGNRYANCASYAHNGIRHAAAAPEPLPKVGIGDARPWSPGQPSMRQRHFSTLGGAFGSPIRGITMAELRNRRGNDARSAAFSFVPWTTAISAYQISTPSRISPSQETSRSTSTDGSSPFSLEHHKISPQQRMRPMPLTTMTFLDATDKRDASGQHTRTAERRDQTPYNCTADLESSSESVSARRILPPHVGTPMRPSPLMIRDGAADSMLLFKNCGSERAHKAKSPVGRLNTRNSWRSGGVGTSSDDEGEHRRPSSGRGYMDRWGGERDDDMNSFNDSGICLPQFTPFHKTISRATFGSSTPPISLPEGAIGMAFPCTVGRPTPLKKRRRGAGGDDSRDGEGVVGDSGGNGGSGGDQFSSPHHPNLAHSLGLAPRSALRSTDSGAYDFESSSNPFHPSQSTSHHMLGISRLGFTPFEKGGLLSGSLGASPGGVFWSDSVRRPLAGSLSSTPVLTTASAFGLGADGKLSRRSSDDLSVEADGVDVEVRIEGSDKENGGFPVPPSSSSRYLPVVDDTPSKSSGKIPRGLGARRPSNGSSSGGAKIVRDDAFDDGVNGGAALIPLRFNKTATSMKAPV